MNKCDFIDQCTFFNDYYTNMPVTAIIYKSQYCDLDYEKCARNMMAAKLGHEQVPPGLFPCQILRAKIIIDEKNPA
jgi:hypothetical protein